jgi:hypothetical protein
LEDGCLFSAAIFLAGPISGRGGIGFYPAFNSL